MLLLILGILVIFAIIVVIVRTLSKRNKKEMPVTGTGAPTRERETGQHRESVKGYVKRCPTCRSIFTDETLAFCLSDGSTLERVANTLPANDPKATLVYREASGSDAPPTVQYHPEMSPNKKG